MLMLRRSKKNTPENLVIGIFHSLSWPHCKEQIQQSMKQDGIQRIIVASSALSMGVDFPNIRYVRNWGPARSLIEQHQEAGRAGRDGAQSHIVICYHGNQLSKCDEDVKNFVKTEGCFRVAAYKPFDKTIAPLTVHHNCCSNCLRNCSCQHNGCNIKLPFEDEVITGGPILPVLLITLYLYINSILKIIRKSCVINLLRYIFI